MILLGKPLVLRFEILVADGQVFLLGDGLQREPHLDLHLGFLAVAFAERRHIHAGVLQIHIKAQALRLQALIKLAHVLVDRVFKHRLRDVRFDLVGELFRQRGLERRIRFLFAVVGQFLADVRFHLVQRVKFAAILRKVVVELRQFAGLDLVQFALEHRRLALELFRVVLFREGDVDVEFLVDLLADDLLLKTRDKLPGAEHERLMLALAARKRLVVHETFVVDHDGVAVRRRAVIHRDKAGLAVLEFRQLRVHVRVGHVDRRFFGFHAEIVFDGDLRFDGDHRFEDKALFADRDNVQVDLIFDELIAALRDRAIQRVRIHDIHRIFVEHLFAVHPLDDAARRLALAETRHVDFFNVPMIRLFDRLLKLLGAHFHFQLHAVRGVGFGCFLQTHCLLPPTVHPPTGGSARMVIK